MLKYLTSILGTEIKYTPTNPPLPAKIDTTYLERLPLIYHETPMPSCAVLCITPAVSVPRFVACVLPFSKGWYYQSEGLGDLYFPSVISYYSYY